METSSLNQIQDRFQYGDWTVEQTVRELIIYLQTQQSTEQKCYVEPKVSDNEADYYKQRMIEARVQRNIYEQQLIRKSQELDQVKFELRQLKDLRNELGIKMSEEATKLLSGSIKKAS